MPGAPFGTSRHCPKEVTSGPEVAVDALRLNDSAPGSAKKLPSLALAKVSEESSARLIWTRSEEGRESER
ncbi:hypothetical protein GCM10020229_54640 [Kitasatospora albolonga]